jgi:hypothetical protein
MPETPRLYLVIALTALPLLPLSPARAQSDRQTVVAVVTRFFDGMRSRDSAMMSSTVLPSTLLERTNGTSGLGDPISMTQFIDRVSHGTGPGGNEQIKDPKVEIDGPLASIWTYYTYTPGGQTKIDHCGVDSFLLRKGPDGWKIFHIADSSRNEGCTPITK